MIRPSVVDPVLADGNIRQHVPGSSCLTPSEFDGPGIIAKVEASLLNTGIALPPSFACHSGAGLVSAILAFGPMRRQKCVGDDKGTSSFCDHRPPCGRCLAGRGWRDHECDPGVPAIGTMTRVELLVGFEVEITLMITDRKDVTELRPDPDHPRLEGADSVATAAVA